VAGGSAVVAKRMFELALAENSIDYLSARHYICDTCEHLSRQVCVGPLRRTTRGLIVLYVPISVTSGPPYLPVTRRMGVVEPINKRLELVKTPTAIYEHRASRSARLYPGQFMTQPDPGPRPSVDEVRASSELLQEA